jgi:lysophospholipase L1-like esterase
MIEDSSEYNFEKERLSDKRIAEIIAAERVKKRLPDLKGVKVYVTGAKAPTREQFYNIQNFWLRYFKECGAELPKENYGSALLSFDE